MNWYKAYNRLNRVLILDTSYAIDTPRKHTRTVLVAANRHRRQDIDELRPPSSRKETDMQMLPEIQIDQRDQGMKECGHPRHRSETKLAVETVAKLISGMVSLLSMQLPTVVSFERGTSLQAGSTAHPRP